MTARVIPFGDRALLVEVDDVAAAHLLAAAVDQTWPRPVVVVAAPAPVGPPAWRFSGRWWTRPETTRRARPWTGN